MFCLSVIVQILLESLPISSSTHLALLGCALPQPVDFFAHGPTALMLLIYFRHDIAAVFAESSQAWATVWGYGVKLFVAELMTGVVFLILRATALTIPLWLGLAITTFLLFSLLLLPRCISGRCSKTVSWSVILTVGCVQALALLPGISRLASTLVAARWIGLDPAIGFRLSCALQVPPFGAAALLGLWQISRVPDYHTLLSPQCIAALLLAMVGGYLLLRLVDRLYRDDRLWIFGCYMLIPLMIALFF
ncbi:MAG: undecaprenyl-diphosphate phosphatase [Candidatus Dependentiae bacterium]|nr:undecaprenyl-diphosphate phosphatase [Candidatus Dependentiae bacterium]